MLWVEWPVTGPQRTRKETGNDKSRSEIGTVTDRERGEEEGGTLGLILQIAPGQMRSTEDKRILHVSDF